MNYPSASEVVRNVAQITTPKTVVFELGPWRVFRFERTVQGFEFWVVSDKGFLWEPCADLEWARSYIEGGCA